MASAMSLATEVALVIKDLIPARARKVVYAVFAFAVPATTTAVALLANGFQASDIPLLVASVASAAGFTLAAGNVKPAP